MANMSTVSIQKAGGVVTQKHPETRDVQVYLIHRPRYDDWTLPKGHLDEGEKMEKAALREVFEETGLMCENLSKLPVHTYDMPNGDGATKEAAQAEVHFYHMKVLAKSNPIDSEADKGEWCTITQALERLSYPSSKEYLMSITEQLSA